MSRIEVCGNDLDWCSRDRCVLYINSEPFEAEKFGGFFETDEAPDYGCASFEFDINEKLFARICNKFNLSKEEEQEIRDKIASNWWGSSCGMCE